MSESPLPPSGQMLIYQDGALNLQVRLDGQTVWLTQLEMAELYQTSVPNINQHLAAIYNEGELNREATVKPYLIVQKEGQRKVSRTIEHYSLDVILAVGYRVRSSRGTFFRQWATHRLREFLVKGFTMDDERIKAGRTIGADYYDELLARIRDIRSSERLFYEQFRDALRQLGPMAITPHNRHGELWQSCLTTVHGLWRLHEEASAGKAPDCFLVHCGTVCATAEHSSLNRFASVSLAAKSAHPATI